MNSQHLEKAQDIQQNLSERIISFFIGKYVKLRYKIWMLRKEANESTLNIQDLSRICSEQVFPVTSPVALISEIQGSGGTLLSQLFDGHSELHVHPHELVIGYPEDHTWPKIDLNDSPAKWFEILFEDIVNDYNKEGYKQDGEGYETFPFVYTPSVQREIFLNYLHGVKFIKPRDIFDAYMTSYFRAWLNNQNYYGSKRFITAYTSRLGIIRENVESFFEVYPDGRLISVVRDPKSWFPSARKRWPVTYTDGGQAVNHWNKTAQIMLWSKKRYGDRVCLIRFKDLLRKTESVMRYLAEFLGIEFDDILLLPTFNKLPINISAGLNAENYGKAINGRLATEKRSIDQKLDTIANMTSETYSLMLKKIIRF